MTFNAVLKNRNFSNRLAGIEATSSVNHISFSVLGGPKEATISLRGGPTALWEALEYLRCPVEIYDEKTRMVWWGFVSEVSIRYKALAMSVGVSIDSMMNRCKVAYSYVAPGSNDVGNRKTTAWAENTESIMEYGYRELILSEDGCTDEKATGVRDMALAVRKWPVPDLKMSGSVESESVLLTCRGWFNTLGWKYATVAPIVSVNYHAGTESDHKFGYDADFEKISQQISMGIDNIALSNMEESLLHFNGADGATTVTDESGKAWTVAGNAQLDTAQKEFGSASLLLDGTGDYIKGNGSPDFAFGKLDFTIDFWLRNHATGSQAVLYDGRPTGGTGRYVQIEKNTAEKIEIHTNSSKWITGTTVLSVDTWYHIALVRYMGVTKLYVNGTQEGISWNDRNEYGNGAERPAIGCYGITEGTKCLNGWIDELRILKGIAAWTGNFTVPAAEHAYTDYDYEVENTPNVITVGLWLKKTGTPTDNILVKLWSQDENRVPRTLLGSGSLDGSTLTTSTVKTDVTLTTETPLPWGEHYIIEVLREGVLSTSDYYWVHVDTDKGYGNDVFGDHMFRWDSGAWAVGSPDGDMWFELGVNNQIETTLQIKDLAMTFGQFLTGVDLDVASGIISGSYRDGDSTALYEIQKLLKAGKASGRRLLATVNPWRRLVISEEPAGTEQINYMMLKDGSIVTNLGTPIDGWMVPVGVWCKLKDVIPDSVDFSTLSDPSVFFIEGMYYDCKSGTLRITPRGVPSPFDISSGEA